jgi:hypothetical protein
MVTFLEQSKPVIEEYEKGGKVKVIKVDASEDIETVWTSTKEQIKILSTNKADAQAPAAANGQHAAFMFIKPHAVCEKVRYFVQSELNNAGISIVAEGEIDAATIDKQAYIDIHYGAIANRAVRSKPTELNVPPSAQTKFEDTFGLNWQTVRALTH